MKLLLFSIFLQPQQTNKPVSSGEYRKYVSSVKQKDEVHILTRADQPQSQIQLLTHLKYFNNSVCFVCFSVFWGFRDERGGEIHPFSVCQVCYSKRWQRNAPMLPKNSQRGVCHDGCRCELWCVHCSVETLPSNLINKTRIQMGCLSSAPLVFKDLNSFTRDKRSLQLFYWQK